MPIVWPMPDGSVQITTLADEFLEAHRKPDEPTAKAVARLAVEHVQAKAPQFQGLIPVLVTRAAVPSTEARRFRNAWTLTAPKRVGVDPDKARAILKQEIRAQRDALLAASDGPTMRETERAGGKAPSAWLAYRQALRDYPARVDALKTVDEMLAFKPEWPRAPA